MLDPRDLLQPHEAPKAVPVDVHPVLRLTVAYSTSLPSSQVYHRDVLVRLSEGRVESSEDIEWLRVLRFYQEGEVGGKGGGGRAQEGGGPCQQHTHNNTELGNTAVCCQGCTLHAHIHACV
jgi:hypothetical protein